MKIDTTQPHIGRIYDFMLGGHHNYEVDRQAAAGMLKVVPTYPKWARLNRWFLLAVANQWAEEGRSRVFDLASGLPTQGHFDQYLPGARILFSDNDPVSVTYGRELLKDRPDMRYELADLREPDALFQAAAGFFGPDRKLAIGLIGISYLLPTDVLRPLLQRLHDFCAPGSTLAISYASRLPGEEGRKAADEIVSTAKRLARVDVQLREEAEVAELISPWRMRTPRRLQDWLDMTGMIEGEELTSFGVEMWGAIADY